MNFKILLFRLLLISSLYDLLLFVSEKYIVKPNIIEEIITPNKPNIPIELKNKFISAPEINPAPIIVPNKTVNIFILIFMQEY